MMKLRKRIAMTLVACAAAASLCGGRSALATGHAFGARDVGTGVSYDVNFNAMDHQGQPLFKEFVSPATNAGTVPYDSFTFHTATPGEGSCWTIAAVSDLSAQMSQQIWIQSPPGSWISLSEGINGLNAGVVVYTEHADGPALRVSDRFRRANNAKGTFHMDVSAEFDHRETALQTCDRLANFSYRSYGYVRVLADGTTQLVRRFGSP